MTKDYRVICTVHESTEFYDIYEVHYDTEGNIVYVSEEVAAPYGSSLEALQEDFYKMEKAFSKPVLNMDDINYIDIGC